MQVVQRLDASQSRQPDGHFHVEHLPKACSKSLTFWIDASKKLFQVNLRAGLGQLCRQLWWCPWISSIFPHPFLFAQQCYPSLSGGWHVRVWQPQIPSPLAVRQLKSKRITKRCRLSNHYTAINEMTKPSGHPPTKLGLSPNYADHIPVTKPFLSLNCGVISRKPNLNEWMNESMTRWICFHFQYRVARL